MTPDQSKVSEILQKQFGFKSFRLEQERIVNSILSQKDVLGVMPTGGGKSLCYQLPALYSEGTCIVISPLISLMQDQVNSLKQNGVEAVFLNSTLTPVQQQEVEEKLQIGTAKLLYVAPERVFAASTLAMLKNLKISLIAIDEAHCVSQWGHEFRSDYRRLGELKEHFPKVPTIALTATADEKTRKDICEQLQLNSPEVYVSGFDRSNIRYLIDERGNEVEQLHRFIKENHQGETGIVYCLSRKKTERVCEELQAKGYNAVAYHAGLSRDQREKSQSRFDREDGLIVVATIAFGMGIDRPDVRFVAHLDLPKSIEGYYQETGRAGRDGEPATAWMSYGLGDVVKLAQMLETTEASEAYKKVARFKLDAMLSLCETIECRRQYLLGYFGEKLNEPCGNCDTCLNPAEVWDATVPAQKLLSTIYRTGQMFGASYVIDVLRGSKNAKILDKGHDQLSVHGIGSDESKDYWNSILRQLLYLDYIQIKDWEYRNLALTEKSRPLLRGETQLSLRKLRVKSVEKKAVKKKKVEIDHGRDDLFQSLREKRTELARQESVPPYIIFSDKTLHEMCQFLPEDKSQMLMINGVGEAKFEKFGQDFLAVVSSYQHGLN